MSLVPIIQPPVIRALTTREERLIRMPYRDKNIKESAHCISNYHNSGVGHCRTDKCSLIGLLMFGNLIRVSGVIERLSLAAQNELTNIVTLLLGITIGATMHYENFLQPITLLILALGLVAFIFDTAGGVLFASS